MKKLFALVLALVMVMSLAATGFATGEVDTPQKNDSITINNAKVGESYTIYKLFDLVVDSETSPEKFTYTVNAAWKAFFDGEGAKYINVEDGAIKEIKDNEGNVTSDAKDLAKAAAGWTGKPEVEPVVADSETVVFSGLDNGYYLITSTLGTVAMTDTTPAKSEVIIDEKNPADTIKKEVKEDSTGEFGISNDAQVGDIVEFKSTATLVPNTRNVKVHDKMDSGLTYTLGSVAIEGLTKGTEYTVNEAPTDGCTFCITFTDDYINGLGATTTLTITYTATLNENAVVKDENGVVIVDQNNKTKITYGDQQSQEDGTVTKTHYSAVYKHADGSQANLAGAEFSLKKNGAVVKLIKLDDKNYRVANYSVTKDDAGEEVVTYETGAVDTFVTVATGDIVIWGLDSDTDYTLEEITAPDGYNKLNKEVKMEVKADNSSRTDVVNKSGTELPSTGGMGTTLFYVVGSIMVLAAVVLLVTKKRMSVEG